MLGRYYMQYFNYSYQRSGTLWEGLPVENIAEASATIAYELLTGVNQRVKFSHA